MYPGLNGNYSKEYYNVIESFIVIYYVDKDNKTGFKVVDRLR